MLWEPALDYKLTSRRKCGRPKNRWGDDIYNFIQNKLKVVDDKAKLPTDGLQVKDHSLWMNLATDSKLWNQYEAEFVQRLWLQEAGEINK